jgi:hypothetical protein
MKHRMSIVHVALSLILLPIIAFAGRVEIYADPALTQCTLADTSPGTANIYVSETSISGDTGLRFRIAPSAGFTGVWISESSPFVKIGNSQTDLSIGFANCEVGQFTVLTAQYQLFGTSACGTLSIAPANGFPLPICTYCSFGEYPCEGFVPLHVNCGGSFNCNPPVSTEPTTWGRVKALYRN